MQLTPEMEHVADGLDLTSDEVRGKVHRKRFSLT
jgi:hypothetical protein